MTAPAFPTSFYLVFVRAVHVGPARWRLIHDEPLDTLDDAATALDEYFGAHDPSAKADDVRVMRVKADQDHSSDWTLAVLRRLARSYSDRAETADDVPLWLIDYAPKWVRDAQDADQVRQMYAEDR